MVVVCEARCSIFGHAEGLGRSCEVFADLEVAELVLLDAAEIVDEVWLLEVLEALLGVGVAEAVAEGRLLDGALVLFDFLELVHVGHARIGGLFLFLLGSLTIQNLNNYNIR